MRGGWWQARITCLGGAEVRADLLLGLSRQQAERELWYGDPVRGWAGGASAFAGLFADQPRARWRLLGRLMRVPPVSRAADRVYVFVADRRHRLGPSACGVSHR